MKCRTDDRDVHRRHSPEGARTPDGFWTCAKCGRKFGRNRQAHECAPALTIEEYFSTGPPWERPIFDAVRAVVESFGPVYIEPVSVGIFFKRVRTFAQLRPMTKWAALSFVLPYDVKDSRIARKVVGGPGFRHHVVNLREPGQVDHKVAEWLRVAYDAATWDTAQSRLADA